MFSPDTWDGKKRSWPRKAAFLVKLVAHDKEGGKILTFFAAFVALMVLSFFASLRSNSLVLSLNGFVLMHRATSLAAVASGKAMMTRTMSSSELAKRFTYGFHRVEPLAQFSSLMILMVACLSTVIEGLQKMLQPHDVAPVFVELVCVVHIVAVVMYINQLRQEDLARARRQGGKRGVLVFYLTECASPILCITSCQLVAFTGISKIDLFAAMIQTAVVVINSIPAVTRTGGILVQRIDDSTRAMLDKALFQIQVIDGVLGCSDAKYWMLTDGLPVVSVKIRLASDAIETAVMRSVNSIFAPIAHQVTVQFEAHGEKPLAAVPGDEVCHGHSHSHSHGGCSHGHSHSHTSDGHSQIHWCSEQHSNGCGSEPVDQHNPAVGEQLSTVSPNSFGGSSSGRSSTDREVAAVQMVPMFPAPPVSDQPLQQIPFKTPTTTPRVPSSGAAVPLGHQTLPAPIPTDMAFPAPPPPAAATPPPMPPPPPAVASPDLHAP